MADLGALRGVYTTKKVHINKLLTMGYCKPRLIREIKKIYGVHLINVDKYHFSESQLVLKTK